MEQTYEIRHIVSSADRCSGRPRIAGTRIRVQDIVADHEYHGLTPEQIAREYPHITLAQVHAALSYYFDHREEIAKDMKEDESFVAEQVAMSSKAPPLKRPIEDANDTSISP